MQEEELYLPFDRCLGQISLTPGSKSPSAAVADVQVRLAFLEGVSSTCWMAQKNKTIGSQKRREAASGYLDCWANCHKPCRAASPASCKCKIRSLMYAHYNNLSSAASARQEM